ncbi:MAG: GatB/YqeY domain-containing protein [Saprospiraceae bacterium]
MSLENTINEDLKTAMKAKDQISLRGIRAIKSAILIYNTSGAGDELNQEREIALLQKLVKQRQDSLDIFEKQGREDLAKIEREEIEVIMRYLPKQLSEDELKEAIRSIMTRLSANTMKDMGRVMGEASKEFAGKADGKTISAVVKALLSN